MFTLLFAFCSLPPLTVGVCFPAATAEMIQSSPTTCWSFSCRRKRRISSETSRWAEKWSITSSDRCCTTRRIGLSRCTSLQTPYRHLSRSIGKQTGQSTSLLVLVELRPQISPAWKWESLRWIRWPPCYVPADVQSLPRAVCSYQTLTPLKLFANWNALLPQRLLAVEVFPQECHQTFCLRWLNVNGKFRFLDYKQWFLQDSQCYACTEGRVLKKCIAIYIYICWKYDLSCPYSHVALFTYSYQ